MEKLGHYEILGELGRGGCGVVYRALDPAIGRTVAIKTILAGGGGDSAGERFRREARSAGNLSHPNIVTIHEFNDSGDVMFIAMEYIDGQTLAQRMSEPNLPLGFILTTVRSASDALDFAHANNIVHRDVKPANFLITKQGLLKITDFGIAKMLNSDVSLTNTGMVIGTVQYMSPEQIAAQEVTGRSDQFSLAVIAYEMLTGQRPFQGNSWASMIHSIMATEPPPLSQHREDLGFAATEVLRRALAKDPAARYPTCREFSDALERAILGPTGERRAGETVRLHQSSAAYTHETMLIVPPALPKGTAPPAPAATIEKTPGPSEPIPPPVAAPSRPWVIPASMGTVIAIGLAAWIVLRGGHSPETTQPPAVAQTAVPQASPASQTPAKAVPGSPSPQPSPSLAPDTPAPPDSPAPAPAPMKTPPVKTASAGTKAPPPSRVAASATPAPTPAVRVPPPTESAPPQATQAVTLPPPPPAISTQQQPASPPPVQSTPVARVVEPTQAPVTAPPPARPVPVPAPAVAIPTPAPSVARGPDPAEVAAQKRAAEVLADRKAISDAVNRYRLAFEARDMDALKAVWPGLGRNEQNSFQSFFRIARSIRLQITPVGEPEITASGATALYRRSLTAADERRPLPAQYQTVRITFRKSGEQMLIDAMEAVAR